MVTQLQNINLFLNLTTNSKAPIHQTITFILILQQHQFIDNVVNQLIAIPCLSLMNRQCNAPVNTAQKSHQTQYINLPHIALSLVFNILILLIILANELPASC